MRSQLRCLVSKALGAQVCQPILAFDVVDADLALSHQFLHEINLSAMCFARGLQVRLPGASSDDVLSIYKTGCRSSH